MLDFYNLQQKYIHLILRIVVYGTAIEPLQAFVLKSHIV